MDANTRLRIATRIHFLLLRHLGEGVDVATMLKNEKEAREVLWVCEGSGDRELMTLAGQYRRAGRPPAQRAAAGHAPQDTSWAGNTTGFGVSQPPEIPESAGKPATSVSSGWLSPVSWLRRANSTR
ncbi:hypothetical protein [Piscinibacter sp. XHJ-5]|uniref:hypothetical protein n=1 Tax=Piscinibacter sp. XHJ-5 TaxID=3037797 RepID=UPI002452E0A6|nr:hypothetical protein [Piscinibacter sp. XHJ-5]